LTTKKGRQNFWPGKSEIFSAGIGKFFGWNRKFLRPDSQPSKLRTKLTPLASSSSHQIKSSFIVTQNRIQKDMTSLFPTKTIIFPESFTLQ